MPTLNWIGKEKVVNHHLEVPYRVLEHRYGYRAENTDDKSFTGSGNMIVHGDNRDDRDNSDSKRKLEVGKKWASAAGHNYRYYMVFDKVKLEEAITVKELLSRIEAMK